MARLNPSGPKARRHRVIQGLVETLRLGTQDELVGALASRGIDVSQSTLSRDLRELGIVKTADGYRLSGPADSLQRARDELARAVPQFLMGLRTAQNLVILRTDPGGASVLAQFVDAARLPEIVGTIAGDDTVFVATPDAAAARRLRAALDAM